jgi:hypothetical protein
MELSARLLGFVPAASLLSHAGFSSLAPGGKTALGFASSRMFGAPFGAFARARPRVDHQPPETASGSYPLMGFSCSDGQEVAAKQSPGLSCPARRFGLVRQRTNRPRRFAAALQRVEGLMPWFSPRAARVDNRPA